MALTDNTTKINSLLTAINNLPSRGEGSLDPLTTPATDSKVVDGYEYYDDQGVAHTGSYVPSVDTGANGKYKDMIEGDVTDFVDSGLTKLRTYALYYYNSLQKVSLPSCLSVGTRAMQYCSAKVIDLPLAASSAYVALFGNNSNVTDIYAPLLLADNTTSSGHSICNANSKLISASFDSSNLLGGYLSFVGCALLKTLVCTCVSSTGYSNTFMNCSNLDTIVCLFDSVPSVSANMISSLSPTKIVTGGGHFYVLKSLVDDIKVAANWSDISNAIVGIDVRTSINKGATFTPSNVPSGVTHWDQVKLQSYDCATINSSTGELTSSEDGRVLVRGLGSNDEIKYVAFVEIGNKFNYLAVE